jgi:two-component system nitrogen regulation sensor histidine kinase NtrY
VDEYQRLDAQRYGVQITFIVFFAVVALLLLLASIWAGLTVANLLVRPISRLITAAEEVSRGNLKIQVESDGSLNNELGNLSQAFNRMISQLYHQRQDLITANTQIDQRRQFMEAILSRITAGVICTEKNGRITLMNRRACELLGYKKRGTNGSEIKDNLAVLAPEIFKVIEAFNLTGEEALIRQVDLVRKDLTRILQVVVVLDQSRRQKTGYIITFDDVTPLLIAQRKAAWSDVARKIAHEIKNPLTPIQLSAERLKRKYLNEIHSTPEVFTSCIDTIIRQVAQIGKLVTEFSDFARMPEPLMRPENSGDLVKQSIFLQQAAHPDISFGFHESQKDILINCDASQIGQVLTNLLQNAINALTLDEFVQRKKFQDTSGQKQPEETPTFIPTIMVTTEKTQGKFRLIIEDNGPGLPIEGREQLIVPYYTTHKKGTGLGLAIVAKIVEDHSGTLKLLDSELGGAKMVIELPI